MGTDEAGSPGGNRITLEFRKLIFWGGGLPRFIFRGNWGCKMPSGFEGVIEKDDACGAPEGRA
jgi:hypothetical protein